MALRNSKIFLILAWSMGLLTIVGFTLRVLLMVSSGHGGDTYVGGKGIPWSYSSVLVTLVAIGIVLSVGLVAWIWRRINRARTRNVS